MTSGRDVCITLGAKKFEISHTLPFCKAILSTTRMNHKTDLNVFCACFIFLLRSEIKFICGFNFYAKKNINKTEKLKLHYCHRRCKIYFGEKGLDDDDNDGDMKRK